jgi:dual specificity phosphatase 12
MEYHAADLVLPRLWLGNREAAADEAWLRANKIDTVFNCTKTLPFAAAARWRYRVPVDDNLQPAEIANMTAWSPEIQLKLLREYKAGRTILVHCHAGMQRSAAVVAMFLMTTQGLSADEAMFVVRQKRPIAFTPAANFEASIRAWEKVLVAGGS